MNRQVSRRIARLALVGAVLAVGLGSPAIARDNQEGADDIKGCTWAGAQYSHGGTRTVTYKNGKWAEYTCKNGVWVNTGGCNGGCGPEAKKLISAGPRRGI